MNPIPDNYEGNMTVGKTNVNSTEVVVLFEKPNKHGGALQINGFSTSTDGTLVIAINATHNKFFSSRYESIAVSVREEGSNDPVRFIDPDDASEKLGVLMSFLPACNPTPVDLFLTKKTESCNCA